MLGTDNWELSPLTEDIIGDPEGECIDSLTCGFPALVLTVLHEFLGLTLDDVVIVF